MIRIWLLAILCMVIITEYSGGKIDGIVVIYSLSIIVCMQSKTKIKIIVCRIKFVHCALPMHYGNNAIRTTDALFALCTNTMKLEEMLKQ